MTVELGFGIPIVSVGMNSDSKAQRPGFRIPPAKSSRFLESGSPYMDALAREGQYARKDNNCFELQYMCTKYWKLIGWIVCVI